jgi:pimeloyl-ACP methyl ester carboxylesterase
MAEAAIAGPAIASRLDLPAFLFSHLSLARTHAVAETPVAARETPYPVLLFSHGWGGLRTQNISQVEELASQGYIVAALDHTFGAVVTVFPDGRTAVWNTSILPFGAPQAEFDQAANQLMDVWAADLSFVLDQLALLQYGDDPGLFRERLDLDRVGVFSHSTGGGATVVFCTRDPRCKAGLAMDAWLEPVPTSIIAAGLDQPFLFMRSEAWEQPSRNPQNDQLQAEVLANLREAGYRIAIKGTAHFDFSSLPLFSPLTPTLGLKGPIDGLRVNDIINAYTLAFFDQYLKNVANPLLDGPVAAYPEVTFRQ